MWAYEPSSSAQHRPVNRVLAQRAEEAWRAAQVATTVSLVAIGVSVILIIVTAIGIVQSGRSQKQDEQS